MWSSSERSFLDTRSSSCREYFICSRMSARLSRRKMFCGNEMIMWGESFTRLEMTWLETKVRVHGSLIYSLKKVSVLRKSWNERTTGEKWHVCRLAFWWCNKLIMVKYFMIIIMLGFTFPAYLWPRTLKYYLRKKCN